MGCGGSKSTGVTDPTKVTEDVKQNVRESWDLYINDDDLTTNSCLIFVKLFQLSPKSKELFNFVDEVTEEALKDNERLHKHAQRVTDAVSTVVANLDDAEAVSTAVKGLGNRHVGYGAKEEYIQPVAQGVLYALERTLKDKFTKDHKKAWVVVLTLVRNLFIQGMKEHHEE